MWRWQAVAVAVAVAVLVVVGDWGNRQHFHAQSVSSDTNGSFCVFKVANVCRRNSYAYITTSYSIDVLQHWRHHCRHHANRRPPPPVGKLHLPAVLLGHPPNPPLTTGDDGPAPSARQTLRRSAWPWRRGAHPHS